MYERVVEYTRKQAFPGGPVCGAVSDADTVRLRPDGRSEQIFYDIYTDEEKAEDPEKENTGLFFFRGDPGAKTAIVNAGGGFVYVAAMHDSFPHAMELSEKGYNAFALIYQPGAQRHVRIWRERLLFFMKMQKSCRSI